MKITAIETLRTEEFANVIWVRVHTDAGLIGLGETFYGAGAVEAQIHDTFAARLMGRDPLHIEAIHRDMLNLPMAQSSTGVEYRAASAIDIALWDLFGKACHQPVHQMLGGLCRDKQRIYNTCAGYQYVRSTNIKPVSNWNLGVSDGPYEDLDGFMNRADAVAESLLENGISAMKIWPFDPAAQENQRPVHQRRTDEKGHRAVRKDPQAPSATKWRSWSNSIRCGTCRPPRRSPGRSSPTTRPGTKIRSG